MKRIAILALVICMTGCAAPFSRPVPTESEYKLRFLTLLQPEKINSLQFSYHGAVGGEASIAKFTVDTDSISQIRANAHQEDQYAPEDRVSEALKRKIKMCAREGRIPDWYDFPFDRSLTRFVDRGGYTEELPAYSREWYVDEDRGIVWVLILEG